MEEKEKNQKTIVAFIAGLLIGGLLVWVFSIAPDNDEDADDTKNEAPSAVVEKDGRATSSNDAADDTDDTDVMGERAEPVTVSGEGSVEVSDQPAGVRVAIDALTAPVESGWIVIHEVGTDGVTGNALGAARFSKEEDLMPESVELLRAMIIGGEYRAVLYADNGNKVFNLGSDAALMKGSAHIEDTFTATAS